MEVWLLNTLLSSTEAGDNVPLAKSKNNSVHCNIQVIFYATVLYLRLGGDKIYRIYPEKRDNQQLRFNKNVLAPVFLWREAINQSIN